MLDSVITVIRFSAYGAWIDIRRQFVRTRLGTLWNALGYFFLVAVLGTFFGTILKSELEGYETYIPFFAFGLVVWIFVSSSINQSCSALGTQAQTMRHTAQPVVALPLSMVIKNFVIFLQNTILGAIVYAVVFAESPVLLATLVAGIVLVAANVVWISLITAIACIRFRDLPQLVTAMLNIAFFLTPIIWREHFLGRFIFLADFNPAYHLVSLIRLPLLGVAPPTLSWGVALVSIAVGGSLTALVHARVRDHIPYWL